MEHREIINELSLDTEPKGCRKGPSELNRNDNHEKDGKEDFYLAQKESGSAGDSQPGSQSCSHCSTPAGTPQAPVRHWEL